MSTLEFTDPRVVAAYIDRFEARSAAPITAYLWHDYDSEEPSVTPVRRSELDMMVIDEKTDKLVVDAAVYTDHQNRPDVKNVLLLSHTQSADQRKENRWGAEVLAVFSNRIAAENLAKMLLGEAAVAFSVVE